MIGKTLVRDDVGGRVEALIVETEAYGGPDDRASHARAGLTRRTGPMFGPAGHAYVYRVYGLHWCLNTVAESDGVAGAVLIRSVEVTSGLDLARARRSRSADPDERLAAGPARVCQTLAIDDGLNGHDLAEGQRLWLTEPAGSAQRIEIETGPRIGVGYAGGDWAARPWRFAIRGHPSVSKPFPR